MKATKDTCNHMTEITPWGESQTKFAASLLRDLIVCADWDLQAGVRAMIFSEGIAIVSPGNFGSPLWLSPLRKKEPLRVLFADFCAAVLKPSQYTIERNYNGDKMIQITVRPVTLSAHERLRVHKRLIERAKAAGPEAQQLLLNILPNAIAQ
jgi:hypothetical protein